MLLHTLQALLTAISLMLQSHVEADALDGRGPKASASTAYIVCKAEVMQCTEEAMAALPDVDAIDFALDVTSTKHARLHDHSMQDLHDLGRALAAGEGHCPGRIGAIISVVTDVEHFAFSVFAFLIL